MVAEVKRVIYVTNGGTEYETFPEAVKAEFIEDLVESFAMFVVVPNKYRRALEDIAVYLFEKRGEVAAELVRADKRYNDAVQAHGHVTNG